MSWFLLWTLSIPFIKLNEEVQSLVKVNSHCYFFVCCFLFLIFLDRGHVPYCHKLISLYPMHIDIQSEKYSVHRYGLEFLRILGQIVDRIFWKKKNRYKRLLVMQLVCMSSYGWMASKMLANDQNVSLYRHKISN